MASSYNDITMNENIHQSAWDEVEEKYIPFVHDTFKSLPHLPHTVSVHYSPKDRISSCGRILNSCAYMMAMFINYEQFGTSYYVTDNQLNPF